VKSIGERSNVILRAAAASGLLVTLVAVHGCGGAPLRGAPPATVTPHVTAGQTVALADLLNFTARTVTGATFDGRRLSGKPVVLWFWAPWCPTCRAQAGWVSTRRRQRNTTTREPH
jgi:thiol-disulfide isomerase/thioredoxin